MNDTRHKAELGLWLFAILIAVLMSGSNGFPKDKKQKQAQVSAPQAEMPFVR
jgi:hypothetical protein